MPIDDIPNEKALVVEGNGMATPEGWVEPKINREELLIDVKMMD
jgi:hypothetical protein